MQYYLKIGITAVMLLLGLSSAHHLSAGPPEHSQGNANGISKGNAATPASEQTQTSKKNPICHVDGTGVELLWLSDNQVINHADHDADYVPPQYFVDADADGYGNASEPSDAIACTPPAGTVENSIDCDDGDPGTNPFAAEIPNNGKDDDCDPSTSDQVAACPCANDMNSLVIDLGTWGPLAIHQGNNPFGSGPCTVFEASDERPTVSIVINRFNEFDPFVWEFQNASCHVRFQDPSRDVLIGGLTAEQYDACVTEIETLSAAVASIAGISSIGSPNAPLSCEPSVYLSN